MLISEFYIDKDIFITGGSGFIGKTLIEKLLRSCPGLNKIFVLLRGKKGKDINERLRYLQESVIFNRLRNENPEVLNKIHAIEGDCSKLGLGISPEDLIKLSNVTVIFHSAASVRFDDELRDAILLNTRGTHELIKIAENFRNLKVFVHISTTYCNPDKHVVEEKVYPPYADWRTTIQLAEAYDNETLNILSLKYSSNQPNTYTFTKSLGEQIINDYRHKLPLVLFRPSIVISSLIEPVPGYIDNFNGPLGMLVACGVGIMRTNYADPDIISDFMPVDIVARALIISAYKKSIEIEKPSINKELDVYNCATGCYVSPITTGEIIEMGKRYIADNPFENTLWVPGGSITRCWVWNFIRFITLHIFMAVLVDSIMRLSNQKPFLLKLQRRIYAANLALYFFLTTYWDFKNDKFFSLNKHVSNEEHDIFGFLQYTIFDYDEYFRNGIRGAKEFLLHESAESTRAARIRVKIFTIIHWFMQGVGLYFIFKFFLGLSKKFFFA